MAINDKRYPRTRIQAVFDTILGPKNDDIENFVQLLEQAQTEVLMPGELTTAKLLNLAVNDILINLELQYRLKISDVTFQPPSLQSSTLPAFRLAAVEIVNHAVAATVELRRRARHAVAWGEHSPKTPSSTDLLPDNVDSDGLLFTVTLLSTDKSHEPLSSQRVAICSNLLEPH